MDARWIPTVVNNKFKINISDKMEIQVNGTREFIDRYNHRRKCNAVIEIKKLENKLKNIETYMYSKKNKKMLSRLKEIKIKLDYYQNFKIT